MDFSAGGGWALVPVFNLVMGLPLVAVAAYVKATVALGDVKAWVCLSAGWTSSRLCRQSGAGRVCGGAYGITVRAQ